MLSAVRTPLLITVLVLALTGCAALGQAEDEPAPEPDEPELTDVEEAVEGSKEMDGLFTLYRDTTDGSLQMLIEDDQLEQEYIYFTFSEEGAPGTGHFRGQFRDNEVFRLERDYDRIKFVKVNTSFYFDPENPLSRAADANIAPATLASQTIAADDTTNGGRYLIDVDGVFLSEALHQVKPSPSPIQFPGMFSMGNLDREKTRYREVNSYPENTDISVEYVFTDTYPQSGGGDAITDPRAVGVVVQHSFLKMPDNDYEPRFDDQRVGYFMQQVDDQTSTDVTPYRDMINRWHLEKEDPDAELSEPVEPIVWWIENTTPEELRPLIRDATLAWNEAFEAAGFENAIEVRQQPDDADWKSGDVRYNVLRWTSSPQPPFGGYGPSFVNPRTGQILGADIMLEFVYLTNRIQQQELFDIAGLPAWAQTVLDTDHDHDEHTGMTPSEYDGCSAGLAMQQNMLTGMQVLEAQGASEMEITDYFEQALYYLIIHEVGHTLGLNHNMQSHNLLSPEELEDPSAIAEQGLIGSIMDYPAVHLTDDVSTQEHFFMDHVGPYDIWAIEFGYDPDLDDEDARASHLDRSTEPALAFGNDADDMRAPGQGIDPRVMINALSDDPMTYSEQRVEIIDTTMDDLLDMYSDPGETYEPLLNAYMILTGEMSNAMNVVSRYVGGVYRERAVVGQTDATQPYTPVPRDEQEAALETLRTHLFAPDAFDVPNEIYNYLQQQRRGFDFFGGTEDPKIHSRALNMQRIVLAHLLHSTVLRRMTDSRLYGNEYPVAEYMDDLTDAIFEDDATTNVNTFRQHLQVEYVDRLASIIDDEEGVFYDYIARSAALRSLQSIQDLLDTRPAGNAETQAHTAHLQRLIDNALD